jgi:hypothetical protein
MYRIAIVLHAAAGARSDLEAALPGEWVMLCVFVVLAAVLGAAVLAVGAAEHRRLAARRVEQWRRHRRAAAAGAAVRPGGRGRG